MRDFSTLGDKLGPKLARLVSDAIVATKRALGPHEVHVRRRATQDVIDQAGREVAEHYRPLIRKMLDAGAIEASPEVQAFLEDAISGEHQLKALGGLLMGPVSGAIGLFLTNELAPFVYRIVGINPQLDLDPQSSANAAAQRIVSDQDAKSTIAQQGYGSGPYETLKELASNYPSIADALDLWRRGLINGRQFNLCLERNAVPGQFFGPFAETKIVPLPPDLAALAVLRSVISHKEGEQIAALSGVSAADFQIMIDDTGEPLGLQELLEAYRRGFIDKVRLERGIVQSRVRNEWIDVAERLRFSPMSVADAVNAVVQNHISAGEAAGIAEQNGLTPGAVDTLIQTAGEPLSRTEMEQLYNRGKVTKAQVLQALRESRLKDKYGEQAFDLHVKLLEPRMLGSAVEFGVVTHAEAIKRAIEYGYSSRDAEILVSEGSARKLQTFKNRVITAAESLYEASGVSKQAFEQVIHSMGFTPQEAGFVIQAADFRRKERQVATTVNAVRTRFIAHHLTEAQATAILDKSGLLAAQRDLLITTWKTERSAIVRNLTEAQVIHAMKKKVLSPEQAGERLLAMGYTETDVIILIASA